MTVLVAQSAAQMFAPSKEGKPRRADSDDPKRNERGLARCDEALAPVTSLPTQAAPRVKQPQF